MVWGELAMMTRFRTLTLFVAACCFACSAVSQDLGNNDPNAETPQKSGDAGVAPNGDNVSANQPDAAGATGGAGSGRLVLVDSAYGTSVFDTVGWSRLVSPAAPRPTPTAAANMAVLGSSVVYFGGDSTIPNRTWMLSGGSWTEVNPPNAPSPRYLASMAPLKNRVVLFGGQLTNFDEASDTWLFDGVTWNHAAPALSPPARAGATLAPLGDRVVLFGGYGDAASTPPDYPVNFADTWTFDGTSWTEVAVTTHPPGRSWATMATLGNRVILFGGSDDHNGDLADTWSFDGSTWTEISVPYAPPERSMACMAALSDRIILFGGRGSATLINDTWSFDGSKWSLVKPASGSGAAPYVTPLGCSPAGMTPLP